MLLVGADYPFLPPKGFYKTTDKKKEEKQHLSVSGYSLSSFDKAINCFDNRTVLWDEGQIGLNQIKVYSLKLPDIFFNEAGKKKITVVLTFDPETRSTRGDSYLGNRMEFHLFHSVAPQNLIEKYGAISENTETTGVPEDIKTLKLIFYPEAILEKPVVTKKPGKCTKGNLRTDLQLPLL